MSTASLADVQTEHIPLVIIGNISHDHVWYGKEQRASFFGGAGLNVALAAAHCGIRPRLISVIGERDHQFLQELEPFISTALIATLPGETCQFEMHYTIQGALEELFCRFGVATYIDVYINDLDMLAQHTHICCRTPLHPSLILPRLVSMNTSFSLDFMVSSASQQIFQCRDWIKYAKCVFVNQQEYEVLEGLYPPQQIQMLVVTNGGGPIRIFHSGAETFHTHSLTQAFYDVTGAGDTLAGTFLVCHILQKEPLDVAMRKAVSAAQASLQRLGVWQHS
jgi:sugar/nucleoside kinase (ribokinase family)